MPLPPESRWIRERPSTSRLSTILMVGVVAILILAVGVTIGALRVEPRVVPAAAGRPTTVAEAEEREWRIVRFAVVSDLVVLRPAWIPAGYRNSAECSSPWALLGLGATESRTDSASYSIEYRGQGADGPCVSRLWFSGALGTQNDLDQDGWTETATFDARGVTVHVQSRAPETDLDRVPLFMRHLWWNESGAHYDVLSNDTNLELDEIIRVIRSLEPVRR